MYWPMPPLPKVVMAASMVSPNPVWSVVIKSNIANSKSPILILDEATSALDNENEIIVGQSLEQLAHGRTTLTIAHRLTTIKNYDRILVLDDTGIAESGSQKCAASVRLRVLRLVLPHRYHIRPLRR